MPPQDSDLEDRILAIERFIDGVLDKARTHPIGRQILRILGLT